VAGFPESTSVSPASLHSTDCSTTTTIIIISIIIYHPEAGTIGQLAVEVSSGLSLTPLYESKELKVKSKPPKYNLGSGSQLLVVELKYQ
jgi:hypothetical protein